MNLRVQIGTITEFFTFFAAEKLSTLAILGCECFISTWVYQVTPNHIQNGRRFDRFYYSKTIEIQL